MAVFSIDGTEYAVLVKSIKRTFQVVDSENTTRTQSYDMYRDPVGTFYNYAIELDTKTLNRGQYDALYETITEPVAFHNMVLPYGQSVYSFKAYVTTGSDEIKNISNKGTLWGSLSFNIIAKSPKRRA